MRRLRLAFSAAATSLFGATSVRDTQIARTASVRRSANGRGGLDPSRRDLRATTVRLYARLLPSRPRGIGKVRGDRLPSWVRPIAAEISDMAHSALAVHPPPAAIRSRLRHVGRGVPRPGRVPPTDAGLLQRARLPGLPGFPGKCRIATATPNCFDAPRSPWTSGWPRRCRQRTAPTYDSLYTRHQRITTAACVAALAAKGSAPRSAPRHYRIPATRCRQADSTLRRSATGPG